MSPPEDDRIAPPARGGSRLPEEVDEIPASEADDIDEDEFARSLLDDVRDLIGDGKAYLEAELTYQKVRGAYLADRIKSALFFGAIAAAFGFVALIALTVGLIIALTPLLTAWGASGLVVGLLVIAALLSARAAKRRFQKVVAVFDDNPDTRP